MDDKIPAHYDITYTLPAVMLSILGMTYYVYIPKVYADEAGISLTVLGLLILLSRIWDALIDPVIGSLSDRTQTRWGRRKPWMALGSVFLAIVFYGLLTPPETGSSFLLACWFGAGSFFFFLFWTAVTVPYEALGVELTLDYDRRTRLLGCREGGILAGTFFASFIPFVVEAIYPNVFGFAFLLSSLAPWYCLALLSSVALAVFMLKSASFPPASNKEIHPTQWRILFRNKPFRMILTAFALTSFGQYLSASLILFYTEHVLGSANGSQFLVLYLGVAFVSIPFWLYLTRRVEKHRVWILSMLMTVLPFWGVLFLGQGDGGWYACLIGLAALFSGGMLTLPASMQADVIDLDEYETGLRREGLFTGIWALFRKLSAAIGTGLAFPALDWFGYHPSGEQPLSALFALRILYAGVPCCCYLGACWLIRHYPVTRSYHQSVRAKIDQRNLQTKEV